MQLFEKAADYQAFEQVLRDTLDRSPMRICAYAVMPNHWHLLLWPECDGELTAFMQRLTITHVRRWQEHRGYAGLGHVYQGRYKSFPVESDEHFWVVARSVRAQRIAPPPRGQTEFQVNLKLGLTLRREARERRIISKCETFHRNPAGSQSRPAEPGQQPEASLAWGWVTITAKRRQRDQTLCD